MNSKVYFPAVFFLFCFLYIVLTDNAVILKAFMGVAAALFLLMALLASGRGGK